MKKNYLVEAKEVKENLTQTKKKKLKKERILAVIFLIFIVSMLTAIVSDVIIRKVKTKSLQMNQKAEVWDALQEYPMTSDNVISNDNLIHAGKKITELKDDIQRSTTDSFTYRMPFVLLKKKIDKMMGYDMCTSLCAGNNDPNDSEDIVLEYSEDYLGFVVDEMDLSNGINNVVDFGTQMEKEGRNFLFFMTPGKYKSNEAFTDYSQVKEKSWKDALGKAGLDMICVLDKLQEDNKDLSFWFFKTDHHWLPSTGIWADKILCETLNEKYGYQLDVSFFDPDQYETTILEEKWLGSQGKKVTEVYCQKEEFPLVLPKYETDLQVVMAEENQEIERYGEIKDTLLNYSVFNETNIYRRNDYIFYGYGDEALIKIHNNKIHDNSHILILKTSFADCMYPYLASVVENLDVIDLRHFNGSLQTYLKKENPDTVVLIYGGMSQGNEGGIYDFR